MKRWIGASVCCFMLGGGQGIVAQKVIFPQEVQANKAQLESNENEWTLKNALLTAKFAKVDGKLIFNGCEEMNLKPGTELFKVVLGDGSSFTSSEMELVSVETEELVGNKDAVKGSDRFDGKAIKAVFKKDKLNIVWHAVLRDGSHYLRTTLDVSADEDMAMQSITPMIYNVDNEKAQAVRGLEQAEILEIIDHHRIGNIETAAPAFFRNQPVGCTATIIYSMYMENAVEIPADIAGIMLSAILSDTLAFRSPTCTNVDKNAAENLAKIAGIRDIEGYATEMFTAGSNLRNKTAEEIFFADFKKFAGGNLTFGVGQISAMSREELNKAKDKVSGEMEKYLTEQKCDMLFFMLTNIMEESSGVICRGTGAQKALEKGFGKDVTYENGVYRRNLPGVVSRKKQMIPNLMNALAEM